MRVKLMSLFAAMLLVAACESTPETTDESMGTGDEMVVEETVMVEAIDPLSQEYIDVELGGSVFFGFDSSVINADSERTIGRWAEWMQAYPQVSVTIAGHCDERGTREYNLALGERRANAAKNYLVALGIDPSRIATISYGKERPAVEGHTEAAWAQNRRDDLLLN
jgi:peptidoglycan-associated lipoprotein